MNYELSMKRYLSSRLERQIQGKYIDFINLSDHPELTIDVIKKYPFENWDWESLQLHPNFNLEWLRTFPNASWSWETMHMMKSFHPSWLHIFEHKPWDWFNMQKDENFNFSWVEQSPNRHWNWDKLSEHATLQQVSKFPHFPWEWDIVTAYSDIQVSDMMKNLHLPWDVTLIRFDKITLDEIPFLRHYQKHFDNIVWADFTMHAEWKSIKTNSDLPWVSQVFTFSPEEFEDSDIEFLRRYQNLNWMVLSMSVPFSVIKKNLDLPWIFEMVSVNKTITYDDVEEFIDRNWDYSVVPCKSIERSLLEWVSASKIKRAWRRSISDPEYTLCKKRIENEFKYLSRF